MTARCIALGAQPLVYGAVYVVDAQTARALFVRGNGVCGWFLIGYFEVSNGE